MLIAQNFPGWTLEYIDGLSYADRQAIIAILGAQNKVTKYRREKAAFERKYKRGRR